MKNSKKHSADPKMSTLGQATFTIVQLKKVLIPDGTESSKTMLSVGSTT